MPPPLLLKVFAKQIGFDPARIYQFPCILLFLTNLLPIEAVYF